MIAHHRLLPWLLLAPAILLLGGLTLYPLGRTLALSAFATDYGFAGATFVGLENYRDLLGDRFFRQAVLNTVVFTLAATVIELALGLGLALLLDKAFAGRSLVMTLLLAPFVLSTMVVTAIWRAWFHYDLGYLNNLLRAVGLPAVSWLFDPSLALWSIVLVDVWQSTPFAFLILLAGLRLIPRDVYEAARIDGAGPWRRFVDMTLPLLAPYLVIVALLRSVDSFKLFDKVYAMTGGGPGNATETISLYVFRQGFRFFDIGMASAAAVVMIAVAGVLAALYALSLMRGAGR
ncbi:carbohydrate ABC transporter permease [Bosea sp. (in: a-proteobacteria)]|jgi:multiple sugar transport system permease protein|uniref:carbohydrate ABC transporter permease n=1 Tax=Bosea sp. (in: a-proteobacteria) TaxID=1871050 RepID=UPI003F6E7F5C